MTFGDRCALLAPAFSARAVAAGAAPWLTDALVPTDAAVARLRRWVEAGAPAADRRETRIISATADYPTVAPWIDRVLCGLPPPVLYHAVHHVLIVVVGRRVNGLCSSLWNTAAPHERLQLVAVDAGLSEIDFPSVTAHELAHAWISLPVIPPDGPLPASHDVRVREASRDDSTPLGRALDELRVATLARDWGLRGSGANVDRYARDVRLVRFQMRGMEWNQ